MSVDKYKNQFQLRKTCSVWKRCGDGGNHEGQTAKHVYMCAKARSLPDLLQTTNS